MKHPFRDFRIVLAIAFLLLLALFVMPETVGGESAVQSNKIFVTTRADSTLRAGYDTAHKERIFCARVGFLADQDDLLYVDSVYPVRVKKASAKSATVAEGARCPAGWGTAHWHLDHVPNTYPYAASFQDYLFAACNRAPFHVIVAPHGEYFAYGFGADLPADLQACED